MVVVLNAELLAKNLHAVLLYNITLEAKVRAGHIDLLLTPVGSS